MYDSQTLNNLKSPHALLTALFCAYLCYSFFEIYLNQFIGDSGKYLIFLIIIAFLFSYWNTSIIIKWYHFFILFWLALKVASIFWAEFNQIVQMHFLSQIGMAALFIVMTLVDFDDGFASATANTLLAASGLMGFLCLFLSEPYLFHFEDRQVLTLMGSQTDPNNQSAYLLVGIAIALYRLFNARFRVIASLLPLAVAVVNTYAILLTGSRGGLLSAALIAACSALFLNGGVRLVGLRSARNLAVVTATSCASYFALKSSGSDDLFGRIFDFTDYAGGSGRVDLWNNALEIFGSHPVLGGGWGSYWGYNGYYDAVHNTYISALSDGGIIGFILLFSPVLYLAYKSLEQRCILPFLLVTAGLAPSFFLDAINKRFFWNAIIIAFILLNNHLHDAPDDLEDDAYEDARESMATGGIPVRSGSREPGKGW